MTPLPFIDIPRINSPLASRLYKQHAVWRARTTGLLPSENDCAMCGARVAGRLLHYHHDLPSDPHRVTPLCAQCHKRRHVALGWGIRKPSPFTPKRRQRRIEFESDVYARLVEQSAQEGRSTSNLLNRRLRQAFGLPPIHKRKSA